MIPPKTARRTGACCHTPVIAARPSAARRDTVARYISGRRRMGTKQNHCGAAMVLQNGLLLFPQNRFNPLIWKENMSAGIDLHPRASARIWGIGEASTKQRDVTSTTAICKAAACRGARDRLDGADPTMEHPMIQVTWPSRSAVLVLSAGAIALFDGMSSGPLPSAACVQSDSSGLRRRLPLAATNKSRPSGSATSSGSAPG